MVPPATPSAPRGDTTFEQFVEFAPDAIVGVSRAGEIVLVNQQAERLFGYDRHELLGRRIELLVPDRLRSQHGARRDGYFRDPRTRPMGADLTLSGRRKDGSEFPAEISLSSIETTDGVLGVAAVRDLSERLRARRKFEQLLEFAPDAIVGVSRSGEIVLVNQQAERLFGYDRHELLGERIERLVPERFHGHHGAHRDGYFADPRTRPMGADLELSGRRKDGSEFPAEISLSSIETEDGVLATAAVRDITDRVAAERERARLEAQLSQSQRLESIGQLAGGVAHDFNNLLGVILNYADFVSGELDASSPAAEDVAEIRRAAERGAALTRQLLTFSRREVVRPEVLDLAAVVADLEKLLRRALGEHIELRLDLPADLPAIEADRGQIEQVLVNLAVNARDAMPTGGVLEIAGAEIPEGIALRVSDTGCGMDPETADRAFEPFFTTKPKGEGSGLGLATVYGIVTQSGGTVTLRSRAGEGTTVDVRLPAVEGTPERAGTPDAAPAGARGETVLVVEDEPAVRRAAERILRTAGYHVLTAAHAADGLALATDGRTAIDLVLTDVLMPGMLGTELAERLAHDRPGLDVVLMSGYSDERSGGPAVADTGRPFVEKPFDAATLLGTVRDALGHA